jgi:hypothetical protein
MLQIVIGSKIMAKIGEMRVNNYPWSLENGNFVLEHNVSLNFDREGEGNLIRKFQF